MEPWTTRMMMTRRSFELKPLYMFLDKRILFRLSNVKINGLQTHCYTSSTFEDSSNKIFFRRQFA